MSNWIQAFISGCWILVINFHKKCSSVKHFSTFHEINVKSTSILSHICKKDCSKIEANYIELDPKDPLWKLHSQTYHYKHLVQADIDTCNWFWEDFKLLGICIAIVNSNHAFKFFNVYLSPWEKFVMIGKMYVFIGIASVWLTLQSTHIFRFPKNNSTLSH